MVIWNKISALLKAPFAGSLDLEALFWLVGAVLVIVAIWVFIINHLVKYGTEI